MRIDVQYSSGHTEFAAYRDAIIAAEATGCDTAWVLDHFDGAMVGGDRPVLECFTLLGALAASTTRIGLGCLVANVANRHSALLAQCAQTVQRISGGRFRLGLGAGAAPDTRWSREHRERGIDIAPTLAERHAQVVGNIEVVRATAPAVPIIVGVNSVELATVAGHHADGVNVRLKSPHAERYLTAAREAAEGRSFECSGWAAHDDPGAQQKAHELGLDRLIVSHLCAFDR
jgi:alkanesulfonate monooxygenase SsuD/methylene tetrahydromethanopterin reductase-like flavin-dependent oxidoreductase (luciferase family)